MKISVIVVPGMTLSSSMLVMFSMKDSVGSKAMSSSMMSPSKHVKLLLDETVTVTGILAGV